MGYTPFRAWAQRSHISLRHHRLLPRLLVALHNLWNGVIVEETAHAAHSFPGKFTSEAKWDSALELWASLNRRP